MGRMKNVDGVDMPLTAEEEAQRDAEEKACLLYTSPSPRD